MLPFLDIDEGVSESFAGNLISQKKKPFVRFQVNYYLQAAQMFTSEKLMDLVVHLFVCTNVNS